jgi:hypothetical protein
MATFRNALLLEWKRQLSSGNPEFFFKWLDGKAQSGQSPNNRESILW